ncbi:MAG: AAA family ATPase [Maricaulaceae bacterium]
MQQPMHAAPPPLAAPMPHQTQRRQAMPPQHMQQHMPPQQRMAQRAPTAAPPVMSAPQETLQREGGAKALPAISIHAFCDRPETAGAINQTQNDWRMKRTNLSIYMGGLPAAIEFYHKESTPGLILIESGMRGQELFSQLEQLASVCDEGTKVVVIGAMNDIRLYRQLIDKGVSDYLVPPLNSVNIIHSLQDLYSDPESPFSGRVVAFFGAKGGVGSSTLAHNIAWSLSERIGQETALVDMDASWGTTGLDFAYDNSQGLEEALAEPERLDEALLDRFMLRHTSRLSILAASGTLGGETVTSPEAYEAVVDVVRSVSPITVLDMPHYWSEWTKSILISSDEVVITATPDLASLRNAKNLIDFLRAKRPNDIDPILILNRTGACKVNEISVRDFAAAVGLDPAVTIGFDPDTFTEAANDGKMLAELKAGAAHVGGLDYLANRLKTGKYQNAPASMLSKKNIMSRMPSGGSKSLLSKLTKGMG